MIPTMTLTEARRHDTILASFFLLFLVVIEIINNLFLPRNM